MDSATLYTIIATLITVLGSTKAWNYYEKRALNKEKAENFLKDDCRERIIKMELLLERSSEEKAEMRAEILKLTTEVAKLTVKVEFLEKENKELHRKSDLKK